MGFRCVYVYMELQMAYRPYSCGSTAINSTQAQSELARAHLPELEITPPAPVQMHPVSDQWINCTSVQQWQVSLVSHSLVFVLF